MEPTHPLIRPPAKFPGGKYYMRQRIVSIMQPHECYVETCGGMASVLLNKPRSVVEIYNDLDWSNWNFFKVLRDRGEEFLRLARELKYDIDTYEKAVHEWFPIRNERSDLRHSVKAAVNYFCTRRMSRGGRTPSHQRHLKNIGNNFAWSSRQRGGMPGDFNAFKTNLETNLPRVIDRLQGVEILCVDANELIDKYGNFEGVLIYDDPPYIKVGGSARTRVELYGSYEMTPEQHVKRLTKLSLCKCMVVLSNYDNNLYRAIVGNGAEIQGYSARMSLYGPEPFRCRRYELPNNQSEAKVKTRRIECVWYNFDPMSEAVEECPLEGNAKPALVRVAEVFDVEARLKKTREKNYASHANMAVDEMPANDATETQRLEATNPKGTDQ